MSEAKAAKRPAGLLACVLVRQLASASVPKPSSAGQLPPVSLPTPRHCLTLPTYLYLYCLSTYILTHLKYLPTLPYLL